MDGTEFIDRKIKNLRNFAIKFDRDGGDNTFLTHCEANPDVPDILKANGYASQQTVDGIHVESKQWIRESMDHLESQGTLKRMVR